MTTEPLSASDARTCLMSVRSSGSPGRTAARGPGGNAGAAVRVGEAPEHAIHQRPPTFDVRDEGGAVPPTRRPARSPRRRRSDTRAHRPQTVRRLHPRRLLSAKCRSRKPSRDLTFFRSRSQSAWSRVGAIRLAGTPQDSGSTVPAMSHVPHALAWATHLDVLPAPPVVERRDGYTVVRSPSNPTHYFGNLLLFDDAPRAGDGGRWEELFAAEFGRDPRIRHCTLAWDRIDGDAGSAARRVPRPRLRPRRQLRARRRPRSSCGRIHARTARSRSVTLDPHGDEGLWEGVLELQTANREDRFAEETLSRLLAAPARRPAGALPRRAAAPGTRPSTRHGRGRRELRRRRHGGRGRFQAVDTALAHRRRGIASRLVVEAGRRAERRAPSSS